MKDELLALVVYFLVIGLILLNDYDIYKKKFHDRFRRK